MKTSDRGAIAIMAHEAIVPAAYFDSKGIRTFGIGHTAAAGEPDPATIPFTKPVDLDAAISQAIKVFQRDLATYEVDVARAIKVPVSQTEFDAAVSFHFNTGAIGRATWVKKLNAGDREGAASGFLAWVKPPEVRDRRVAERALFAYGAYPTTKIPVYLPDSSGRINWTPVRVLTPDQALELMRPKIPVLDAAPKPPDHQPPGNPVVPAALPGGNFTLRAIFAAWWAALFRRD